MFEIGEYIVYGNSGVCQVEGYKKMSPGGDANERLYYVLLPACQKGGTIFTPVDNEKTRMRRILTQEEAEGLLAAIPEIDELTVPSEKLREESYKQALRSCDCREWIRMIKTLFARRSQRIAQGKKITSTDERYLKMAEDYLYAELEIPLGVTRDEIRRSVEEKIGQKAECAV